MILKKLKLLLIKDDLVDFMLDINRDYDDVKKWADKTPWKLYDNIHSILNTMEKATISKEDMNKSRSNLSLKIFFISKKINNGMS